ncbi:MAG: FapA family protein [Pseudobutyrivibrio sp.]|nr:FapA family protein [Pseudobutyrivibrio sp.]
MEAKNTPPKVNVSRDGLEATITFSIPSGGAPKVEYSVGQIIGFLNQANVTFGIDQEAIAGLSERIVYQHPIVVARGYPCVEGQAGYYEFTFEKELAKKPVIKPDGSTDYMNIKTIEVVHKDDLIAIYHPAVQGTSGMSVRGTPIMAKPARDLPPLMGKGFNRSNDNLTYTAAIDGKIEVQKDKVIISPVHEIKGDADISTGNIEFNGDVVINGSVKDGVVIKAGGNVTVKGLVENCEIYAGRDLFLLSGTKGGDKTILEVGGSMTAQFLEFVVVNCGGNITADYLFKCKITCDGKIELTGKKASIIGGFVSAVQGIEADEIGNSFGTNTSVSVGVDREREAAMERLRSKIEDITTNLEKIKKGIEIFELAGRERGLDFSKDPRRLQLLRVKIRDEAVANRDKEELSKMEAVAASGERAKIRVYRKVYSGTTVTIDDHHAFIKDNQEHIEFSKSPDGIRMSII